MDFRYKTFHDTQLINAMPNVQNTLIIDMQEIIGDRAFTTMQKVAKHCGFEQIPNQDSNFFTQKISEYEGVLPLTLEIPQHGINIFITTKFWIPINGIISYEVGSRYEGVELPKEVENITESILDNPTSHIIFVVAKGERERILRLSEITEVKQYCKSLIEWVEKQKQIEDSKNFSELELLEYLKADNRLCKKFYNVLESHLAYIQQHRPDIVESWKYYQEFEKSFQVGLKRSLLLP